MSRRGRSKGRKRLGDQGDLLSDEDMEANGAENGDEGPGDEGRATETAADEPADEPEPQAGGQPLESEPQPDPDPEAAPDPHPEPETAPDPAAERLARARELAREGREHEALAAYREVTVVDPASVAARNELAMLHDALGQHEAALEHLQAARELDPENVAVVTNLGSVLGILGRFDEGERELRRGHRLDPESVDVRAQLGILYFRRGLYAQAETELRWVCERAEDHGPAHFYRGEALNRLGKVEPAIEVLQKAVRLQPENAKAYYTLGILFDRKHMRDEAARMYRKSRELSSP